MPAHLMTSSELLLGHSRPKSALVVSPGLPVPQKELSPATASCMTILLNQDCHREMCQGLTWPTQLALQPKPPAFNCKKIGRSGGKKPCLGTCSHFPQFCKPNLGAWTCRAVI